MASFRKLPATLAVVGGLLLLGCEQPSDPYAARVTPNKPLSSVTLHEPDGFVAVTDWPMDSLHGAGWRVNSAECSGVFVVPDETTPGTAPNVAEFHVAHSPDGAYCRSVLERSIASTHEFHLAISLKLGVGWQGATDLVSVYNAEGAPSTFVGLAVRSGADGQLTLALSAGDAGVENGHLENSSASGQVRYLGGNASGRDYVITPGQWYRVEIHAKQSSSPTSRDGILQWWANQSPIGDYRDVNFLEAPYTHFVFSGDDVWNVPADTARGDDIRISVPSLAQPGAVNDLRIGTISLGGSNDVPAVWSNKVYLTFRGVDDGAGGAAKYDVRYSVGAMDWESAAHVTQGTCADPSVSGNCSVTGLSPNTNYSVQLVAYRGDLNQNPVFGPLSNVVSVTTKPAGSSSGIPGTVQDLAVTWTTTSEVQLSFTDVDDGTGEPASYDVRYANTPIGWGWGSATVVSHGWCSTPVKGVMIGERLFCTVEGLSPGTSFDFQLVAFRGTLNQDATFGGLSNVATGTTQPSSTAGSPGTVHDLAVTATTQTSATLAFTEVDDGSQHPAAYEVRYAATPIGWGWGSATVVTEGTCRTPVTGRQVGAQRLCTVEGLSPGTSYDFQMVAYRGTLNANPTFGGLSNVATGATPP